MDRPARGGTPQAVVNRHGQSGLIRECSGKDQVDGRRVERAESVVEIGRESCSVALRSESNHVQRFVGSP